MANTIYGTDTYLAAAQNEFNKLIAPLSAFSFNPNTSGVQVGQSITVPLVKAQLTGSAFTGNYEVEDNSNVVAVKCIYSHSIQSINWSQQNRDVNQLVGIETIAATNASALMNTIFLNAASYFVTASFGSPITGVTTANFSAATLQSASIALGNNGADLSQCSVLGLPGLFSQAITPNSFNIAAVQSGKQSFYGLSPVGVNILPTIGGLVAVAVHPGALAVATALPYEDRPQAYLRCEQIPLSNGMVIQYKEWKNTSNGKTWGVFEAMSGAAVGNTKAAVLITN